MGLGHRRLTIMDRSDLAAQPMRNEDGSVWIVFNGEIYNYLTLREGLIQRGHQFQSQSDTEVILHLYEERGLECVKQLRGMFAFAIWDKSQEQLLLARDRLGKKPLYYTQTPERFLFASEIKALWQDESLPREINIPAIHHYLSLGYVPGPHTAFQNIFSLPPAHTLVFKNGVAKLECYWHLSFEHSMDAPQPDVREVQAEILARLREALSLRLASAVPVGVLLSGGLDSSLLVALMAQVERGPIKTFSIRFPEQSHDEAPYARQVAELFHTEHHEFGITTQLADLLPEVARTFDEPFGDSSALPTYFLAKMVKPEVTVALNGDGGDEAFGGYDRYTKDQLAAFYLGLPAPLRTINAGLLKAAIPSSLAVHSLPRRLQDFAQFQASSPAVRYYRWVSIIQAPEQQMLYTPEFYETGQAQPTNALIESLFQSAGTTNPLEAALHTDIHTYLPDDLLVKMDRAMMAFGVETRSPFLDQDFMEYAAGLPAGFKIRHLTRKWILKQASRTLLPLDIIQRPKHGFGLPVGEWLRGALRPMVYDVLLSKPARERGYFRPEAIQAMLDQHSRGQANWQFHLWSLLMLELWQLNCVEAARPLGHTHLPISLTTA